MGPEDRLVGVKAFYGGGVWVWGIDEIIWTEYWKNYFLAVFERLVFFEVRALWGIQVCRGEFAVLDWAVARFYVDVGVAVAGMQF